LKRGKDTSAHCLGCLALSADTLLRECFLYAQDAEEHCIRLLAHALAHLMGLEHGPEMDRLTGRLERTGQAAYAARLGRM
jgi:probable rRNA maturation factor